MQHTTLPALMCIALFGGTQPLSAATIIRLSLGDDDIADIEYDGATLSTASDGNGATTGDQNTDIQFLDFLAGNPDVPLAVASFTMDGLTPDGPPSVTAGVLVMQRFTGGSINLFDSSNTLLLSGSFADSALAGPIGLPGTGGLFTTSFSSVTGGTLAPFIFADTMTLAMNLDTIGDGAGFSVGSGETPVLEPFTADVTVSVRGEVPEPASATLAIYGTTLLAAAAVPRRFLRRTFFDAA